MIEQEKNPEAIEVLSDPSITQPKEPVNVSDYDIDGFLGRRTEFITKVNAIMVEGKDYHVIQGKKSLAKGGAEKIASIFGWSAYFTKDEDVIGAFKIDGLIAFKCSLSKHGSYIGQGRGAATLAKNANDPNKTIKMAQKSAFIDAVLRSSGMSDFFTQDLEDHPEHLEILNPSKPMTETPKPTNGASHEHPISKAQIGYLKGLILKKEGQDVTSETLGKLTRKQAHEEIERLLKLEDFQEIPTIQLEE